MQTVLQWFDNNPGRYWWMACLVIASVLFLMLRPLLRPDWKDVKRTDWIWGLVILGILIAGRWPVLFFGREINHDESQLIAGAITLRHDFMFWRSVDGATAGPLDFYALLPAGWMHGANDYFTARITALFLVAAALTFTHQTIALVFGRQLARITGFSVVCFESLTQHADLLHYSTELVSISLLAAAIFLGARQFLTNARWQWNAAGGLLLGAVPLAKLQAAPLAALVGLAWVAGEFVLRNRRPRDWRRRLTSLVAGAVVPALVASIALTLTGEWHNAIVPYFLNTLSYVISPWELNDVLGYVLLASVADNGLVIFWLGGAGVWLLFSLPLARDAGPVGRIFASGAIVLCIVALGCIFLPCRPFVHYWQLLVVPLTLVVGSVTGLIVAALESRPSHFRCAILCGALVCTTGGLVYARGTMPDVYFGRLAVSQANPRGPVAREVGKYARPGEALGVWGIITFCYVETGMRQATRSAHSQWEILEGPYNSYFRQRYLADLRLSAPPVFVDAVGPGNIAFEDRRLAHDALFPELATYIREHYIRVAEIAGARVYVRNERLSKALTRPGQAAAE